MSHYRNPFLYLLALLWLPLTTLAADASLILKNGRIWTGDPDNPWAEAIAIRGTRIEDAGNNPAVGELAGPGTRVIDLRGRLAIPGFNDAGMQFLKGSLNLAQVDLNGACTIAELQKRIRDHAAAHPRDAWISGFPLQYECFAGHRPTTQDLDAAVADRPVSLSGRDGRPLLANTKAIQLLKLVPDPARERKIAALEQGLKLAASLGITSIQTSGGDADLLSLFDELERQHKLTLRVNVALSVWPSMQDDSIDRLLELKQDFHSLRLRAGAVQFIMDGWTPAPFANMMTLCDSGGFQIVARAGSDNAVRMALDAYEDARKINGPRDARFRIEHIQTLSPADLQRLSRLGVLASLAPGPAAPWHALEQAGVRLVLASDWPAAGDCDPLRRLQDLVNQRVSVDTAMRAYTVNGAYSSAEEKMKGKLKKSMLADIAVLSADVFSIPPAEISKTKVDFTIFDGQVVYSRP